MEGRTLELLLVATEPQPAKEPFPLAAGGLGIASCTGESGGGLVPSTVGSVGVILSVSLCSPGVGVDGLKGIFAIPAGLETLVSL